MTRTSPLTADEIAAVRKPYRAASLLPGRAYHDPAIFDFERTTGVVATITNEAGSKSTELTKANCR